MVTTKGHLPNPVESLMEYVLLLGQDARYQGPQAPVSLRPQQLRACPAVHEDKARPNHGYQKEGDRGKTQGTIPLGEGE